MIKLSSIKPNPDNPRLIKDDDFKKLCQSIEKFPKMMELGMYKGKLKQAAIPHLGEGFVTNEKGEFESTEPLKISS